jgi:hypothetical protein
MKGFLEPGPEGPICMVNLLKFKPRTEYEDGRDTDLTGREAYHLYAEGVKKLLQQVGGYVGFNWDVERLALGLAAYPSRQAMLEMMQLDGMQEISVHRSAGLAGQLNIETSDFTGR